MFIIVHRQHHIDFSDILLIEGLDDYIRIQFEGKKPITERFSMKDINERLHGTEFARVHRSCIIPFGKLRVFLIKPYL